MIIKSCLYLLTACLSLLLGMTISACRSDSPQEPVPIRGQALFTNDFYVGPHQAFSTEPTAEYLNYLLLRDSFSDRELTTLAGSGSSVARLYAIQAILERNRADEIRGPLLRAVIFGLRDTSDLDVVTGDLVKAEIPVADVVMEMVRYPERLGLDTLIPTTPAFEDSLEYHLVRASFVRSYYRNQAFRTYPLDTVLYGILRAEFIQQPNVSILNYLVRFGHTKDSILINRALNSENMFDRLAALPFTGVIRSGVYADRFQALFRRDFLKSEIRCVYFEPLFEALSIYRTDITAVAVKDSVVGEKRECLCEFLANYPNILVGDLCAPAN